MQAAKFWSGLSKRQCFQALKDHTYRAKGVEDQAEKIRALNGEIQLMNAFKAW